jgi:hypothetical protein
MNRVVILQPGYLPWLGFFDLMHKADTFVVLDDVQYTTRDWRSRNRIKTPNGAMWLTVPVESKGARRKLIKDVKIDKTQKWQRMHMQNIQNFYKKAWHYDSVMEMARPLYSKDYIFLIDLLMDCIDAFRHYLELDKQVMFSSDIPSVTKKDEKLLAICKYLEATHYLTGNAAEGYLRESIFNEENIEVEWHNYKHPFYNQLWIQNNGFISHLSIVDLLLNHGPDSLAILTLEKSISKPADIVIRHANN